MRKKLLLIAIIAMVTGCTEYKQIDKKTIIIEDTGQKVVENILCKTEVTEQQFNSLKEKYLNELETTYNDGDLSENNYNKLKLEIEEKLEIEDIVDCQNFKITSGKNTIWETFFVKPIAWLMVFIEKYVGNFGYAIIIVTLLIRLAMYPITKKTAMQSENMKLAKNKLTKLEEKYRNKIDQESQMMKSQELMKIYKEYNINPLMGCLFALIQIPLFFAFYESLYRLPVILEETFMGINLGITPLKAISLGSWYYAILVILVSVITYFSFKLNTAMSQIDDKQNQMIMMSYISTIMITIAAFTVSTGIAIYWITNSSFTVLQNLIVKKTKKNNDIR